MKKCALLIILLSVIYCSCESNGPKSRYYEDTRTSEEGVRKIGGFLIGCSYFHTLYFINK